MKNFTTKAFSLFVKAIPVFAALALVINTNSVATPINGQPEAPAGLKKYRLF